MRVQINLRSRQRQLRRVRLALAILIVTWAFARQAIAGPGVGLDLKVDIGVADVDGITSVSPDDVQAGFSAFSVVPTQNGNPGNYDQKIVFPQIAESRTFAGVTVSLQAGGQSNGLLYFDFATEVTDVLGDLAEDGVGAIQSDIVMTLHGLAAGNYQMTTYHHWAGLNPPQNPFDISVNTGNGEVTAVSNVPISVGFQPTQHLLGSLSVCGHHRQRRRGSIRGQPPLEQEPFLEWVHADPSP